METKRDSVASTILNYFLQLLGLAGFYWLMLYTTIHYWLRGFIFRFAKLNYDAGPNFTKQLYLLLLLYCVFCYLANRFLLNLYNRNTAGKLILSIILDYFIWPLQVLIMLLYNNIHITSVVKDVSTLYNVYIITALLIIKTVIFLKFLSGDTVQTSVPSSKTH